MKDDPQNFINEVHSSLQPKRRPLYWYYLAFESVGNGEFSHAIIIEGDSQGNAIDAIQALGLVSTILITGTKIRSATKIPAEQLPVTEYRNRKLTRAEVERLWPKGWML